MVFRVIRIQAWRQSALSLLDGYRGRTLRVLVDYMEKMEGATVALLFSVSSVHQSLYARAPCLFLHLIKLQSNDL